MVCPHCQKPIPHPNTSRIQALRHDRRLRGECIACGTPLSILEREQGHVRCQIHRRAEAARARRRRNS